MDPAGQGTKPVVIDVNPLVPVVGVPAKSGEPTPPPKPPPAPVTKAEKERITNRLGGLITLAIFAGILFFALVWPNIPTTLYQVLALAGLVAVFVLIGISVLARESPFFLAIRNAIIVIVISFGAAAIALVFTETARDEVFKLFVVVYFSLLPAFLYLQFMSIRGRTLWEEYIDNLFRLRADEYASLPKPPRHSRFHAHWVQAIGAKDPPKHTLYQQKFEGVFGTVPADETAGPSFAKDKLAPVIMATILLSVGWVLVVMPASIFHIWTSAKNGTDSPHLPIETIRFGFLGAYFYAVQMLVRRYFQNDLKASAYLNVIMRIVVVALLTWILHFALEDTPADRNVFAFIVGVFPDVGWKALQAAVKLPLRGLVRSLHQSYPLSDLDGLNVWYEARLLEEGIEDMQNLATCSLVDVMLNTRIPVDRLIDWVDQSLLYLHLGKAGNPREKLRSYGIRTATDLEDAFAGANKADDEKKAHLAKLERVLNADEKEASILVAVLATLRCEPNFHHVSAWRREHAQNGCHQENGA